MGFLLGAFGKLAAGQRKRDIQARMMRIQSKLRIATRQISNVSKYLENSKKGEINAINSTYAGLKYTTTNLVQARLGIDPSTLTDQDSQKLSAYQQAIAQQNALFEQQKAFALQQVEDKYEYLNDTQLEPLKMEENALQLEKDSLESQMQIADADYKACQQMEQADAKDMAPKYTAGGGG